MIITIFNTKETKGKTPISPYDDLTFDFKCYEVSNMQTAYRFLVKNFALNLPLKNNVRTFRRKSKLKLYSSETYDYMILDINDVFSIETRNNILRYFKNYKCIMGESRSYDGVSNFNLKGILCIEPLEINNLKLLSEQIREDLKDYGTLDTATTRYSSVTAPINKYNIFLDNPYGQPYAFVYRPMYTTSNLNRILSNDFTVPVNINLETVKTIDELCLKVFSEMGFIPVKENGKCMVFKHPSETKSSGGYFWFRDSPFIMHHYNAQKTINIFYQIKDLPEAKKILNKAIDYQKNFITAQVNYNIVTIEEEKIQANKTLDDCISSFINKKEGLFAIKSPMGSGKSLLISEIIKEGLEQDLRILVCTNRISVANDFKQKYGLKIYNSDRYKLGDSIIVQYDSLWKYNIKNFDMVILDEFMSLLLHTRNAVNNTAQNFVKFFASFNKKMVIADAFLTGYENIFLEKKQDNLWLINNEYRDSTVLYSYTDYNCFIRSILIHARKHKITVSCTVLNVIYALKALLESYKLKVITLTASTPECVKSLIYKSFNEHESKYDVLIFSPTLTVGVSNMNNVEYHFHYDNSMSCDVISSLQMIKRTRKVKEIHFYVKNKINYLKTTYQEIKDEYTLNIGNNAQYNYLFTITNYGEYRLSEYGKKAIYVDLFKNILEYDHRNAFLHLLNYQFANQTVVIDNTYHTNILLPYIKQVKLDNEKFMEDALNDYMSLSNLDRSLILNLEKQKIFEYFETLSESLTDCTPKIKNEILHLTLTNPDFIDTIKRYKLLHSQNKIKTHISDCLLKNGSEVKFWNNVLKANIKPQNEFLTKDLSEQVIQILLKCGYYRDNGKLKVDADVLKFMEFINDY